MSEAIFYGTGRRKSSVARVFMKPGKGEILVNGKPFKTYLCRDTLATIVLQPLVAVEGEKAYNINVNAICPGSVEGDRLEKVIDAEVISKGMSRDKIYKAYTEGTSLKKLISPKDVADMAFFLASQKSKLVRCSPNILLMFHLSMHKPVYQFPQ